MRSDDNIPDTIPYGYCHCGCGEKTTVASKTDRRAGQVRGEPIRYRVGHNFKKMPKIYVDGDTKMCSQCGRESGFEDFYIDRATYDGRKAYCIKCARRMAKIHRGKFKDKILARTAEWRARNKDWIREYNKEYVKSNAEKVSDKKREYNRRNADRVSRQHKLWCKRNPDSNRVRLQNRRARILHNGGRVSRKDWSRVLSEFDGKCAKCGSSEDIHMDHVIPLSKGGAHSPDNIQPLCAHCNLSKHTKTEDYRGKMYRPAELPLPD